MIINGHPDALLNKTGLNAAIVDELGTVVYSDNASAYASNVSASQTFPITVTRSGIIDTPENSQTATQTAAKTVMPLALLAAILYFIGG